MDGRNPTPAGYVHRHRILIGLLAALAAAAPPDPIPAITVEAWVADDLRTISGVIQADDPDLVLVSAWSRMPEPQDDLTLLRTFPEAPDEGSTLVEQREPGRWTFTTRVPRRFGDVGATRRGLFANGWWLPVPLDDDRLQTAHWQVTVTVPDDAVGVVGSAWSVDTVRWSGTGDRVSLAVLPDGVGTTVADGVTLVTRGQPRDRLVRELTQSLATVKHGRGVVVQAPMRRRLARSGLGTAYVSDRAFRVTAPLHRFHRVAVAKSVFTATHGAPTAYQRDLVGTARVITYRDQLRGPPARKLLGWFSWMPSIDVMIFDGTLPFHSDALESTFPGDPVADDPSEAYAPHWPATAVLAQLTDMTSQSHALAYAEAIERGFTNEQAATYAQVPLELTLGRDRAYPQQDYHLDVRDGQVHIARQAASDSPPEAVTVRIGGDSSTIIFPEGSSSLTIEGSGASVVLDPARHTAQTSRVGDAWPPRFRWTAAGGVSTVNLSGGWVAGGAAVGVLSAVAGKRKGARGLRTDSIALRYPAHTKS